MLSLEIVLMEVHDDGTVRYHCNSVFLCVQILSADGSQSVGKITKQWSGLAKEYFTDADNFGIQCTFINVRQYVHN